MGRFASIIAVLLSAGLGTPAAAAGLDTRSQEPQLSRALEDVRWLAQDIGPRPDGSAAERQAVIGIADRLRQAGWTPTQQGCATCVLACRGPAATSSRLFLAHTDTVPDSPGAVDNAAGVAALLELARTTTSDALCLGFPGGEELGLVGSSAMANAWPGALPRLVVALDLTGQGRLSVTGLGPAWSGPSLRWLQQTVNVDSPFAYRVVSRALPGMERSDHLPFARAGALSLHLLGRGPGGVFARYHQPIDTNVEPAAMAQLLTALQALATAPLPPKAAPDAAVLLGPLLLPAPAVWALLFAGALSGLHDLLRPCEGLPVIGAIKGLLMSLWRCLLAGALAALALAICTLAGLFTPTQAETTARLVMEAPATGWWTGVLPGLAIGWAVWLVARRFVGSRGSAPLAATVLGGLSMLVDPLLALPFAAAALLTRLHPLLGALPALYLLWPDKLRELTFHGLLPTHAWGALWLLAWPAFGAYSSRRRRETA